MQKKKIDQITSNRVPVLTRCCRRKFCKLLTVLFCNSDATTTKMRSERVATSMKVYQELKDCEFTE